MAAEQGGFVSATRGTKGGYCLSRLPEEIRLSEVIKVLEQDEVDGHCENYTGVLDSCVHKGDCGIRLVIVTSLSCPARTFTNHTGHLIGNEKTVDQTFHQIKGINWEFDRKGDSRN